MATANFCTMENFPLFARDYEDEFDAYVACREIEEDLESINADLLFHKISVQDRYYTGVQFYVDDEYEMDKYNYTNDECHYNFGCCRSVAYRKYAAEIRKINRKLTQLGKLYGFQEYVCTARFSNGEAIFSPASPRSRLYAAATA